MTDFDLRVTPTPAAAAPGASKSLLDPVLVALELVIAKADIDREQERVVFAKVAKQLSAQTALFEEATAAVEASGKDKAAKAAAQEAAAAAEAEVARLEPLHEEAEAIYSEVNRKYESAVAQLRAEHTRFSTAALYDETRAATTHFRSVVAETDASVSQCLLEERRLGAEARRVEQQAQRAEDKAELLALRDMVDPEFYKDEYVAAVHHDMHGRPMLAGVTGKALFGDPKPVPNHPNPEHTPPLPSHQRLHRIAKFSGEDKVTLDAGTRKAASVAIARIELGDKAMHPAKLQGDAPHEAVYLVQQNSTSTTWARGRPFWVNEQRLTKNRNQNPRALPHEGGCPTRGVGPAQWNIRWAAGRTFEQARACAIKELEAQLELERKVEQGDLERSEVPPQQPVPIMYRPRPEGRSEAWRKHMRPAGVSSVPASPAGPPPHHHQQQQKAIQRSPISSPRGEMHPALAGMQIGSGYAVMTTDAGGYRAGPDAPSSPERNRALAPARLPSHCKPSGMPRPGSAVRPAVEGRKPVRPFSAAAAHVNRPSSAQFAAGGHARGPSCVSAEPERQIAPQQSRAGGNAPLARPTTAPVSRQQAHVPILPMPTRQSKQPTTAQRSGR